jgi:hypothetical protein
VGTISPRGVSEAVSPTLVGDTRRARVRHIVHYDIRGSQHTAASTREIVKSCSDEMTDSVIFRPSMSSF